jgi:hypothetical protein
MDYQYLHEFMDLELVTAMRHHSCYYGEIGCSILLSRIRICNTGCISKSREIIPLIKAEQIMEISVGFPPETKYFAEKKFSCIHSWAEDHSSIKV